MQLITFDYFLKVQCFQLLIILKRKPGRVNLTVALNSDYCQTIKILHHLNQDWRQNIFLCI